MEPYSISTLLRRFRHPAICATLLVAFCLLFSPGSSALATDSAPGAPPDLRLAPPAGPCDPATGKLDQATGACIPYLEDHSDGVAPLATGGPDEFGYSWDDGVAFHWVDATAGTDVHLVGDDAYTGPLSLGFPFRFYENTYFSAYASTNGLLTFESGTYAYNNWTIPWPAAPNNFIAPFWDDLAAGGTYNNGKVYALQGGAAPNRFFVVEWKDVTPLGSGITQTLTFEAILYENGDIRVQYLELNGRVDSATVGIENDIADIGLQYLYNAPGLTAGKAVLFHLTPRRSVKLLPQYAGQFASAGQTVAYQLQVGNRGLVGPDTVELSAIYSWTTTIWQADGTTPLADSDFDGLPDTGVLAPGAFITITVKVQVPLAGALGAKSTAAVTARSKADPSLAHIARLEAAIPAPFAQVFTDDADNGDMSLYLAQTGFQKLVKTTGRPWGSSVAVAETRDGGFVYAWTSWRSAPSGRWVYEVQYLVLDRYGRIVRPVTWFGDLNAATTNTSDYDPALAVAGDGRIGLLWYRLTYNATSTQYNYNIYFAVLSSDGAILVPPVNVTNNNLWGKSSDDNIPALYNPRLAGTENGRFVLAWQKEHHAANYQYVDDIYYAVRSGSGAQIKPVTKLTNDTPGSSDSYSRPAIAALSGNAAMLAYYRQNNIYGVVLDSNGLVTLPATNLTNNRPGSYVNNVLDAVQLSDGTIVLAWDTYDNAADSISFATLSSGLSLTSGPTTLNHPAALTGGSYVSVAADNAGHAILTWMDYDDSARRYLYYALVSGTGSILTSPTIFRTSQAPLPGITTSFKGYGNTSYSWQPATGVDAAVSLGTVMVAGSSGGAASLSTAFRNDGLTTATAAVLTATLDAHLTYLYDTSGITATVQGSRVVWRLPDLAFMDNGGFVLRLGVPAAVVGTRFPVTLTIGSAEVDAVPANNVAHADIMVARSLYLPVIVANQ